MLNVYRLFLATTIIAGGLIAAPANATTIINGSFEDGPLTAVLIPAGGTDLPGWTVGAGYIDYYRGYWQAADGIRSIDLAGASNSSISQVLDTVIGQEYRITFSLAGNPDGGPSIRTLKTSVTGSPDQTYSFTVGPEITRTNMGWQTFTYQFTASDIASLLTFTSATNPDTSYGPVLDNVSITAVPEPATWGMMILGFGLIGAAIRRRNMRTSVTFA